MIWSEISAVATIASVLGFGLAVWQSLLARKQSKNAIEQAEVLSGVNKGLRSQTGHLTTLTDGLQDQARHLSRIGDALSTRYVGLFPKYLPEVTKVLNRAENDLLILCSLPNHAVFTKHEAWLETKDAIEKAIARKILLRAIFNDTEGRHDLITQQFRQHLITQESYEEFRSRSVYTEKIEEFIFKYAPEIQIEDIDRTKFLTIFDRAATQALNTTYVGRKVDIKEVSSRMSLYMWVADSKEAVFAIVSLSPVFASQAFWTSDSDLIKAFISVFNGFEEQAKARPRGS